MPTHRIPENIAAILRSAQIEGNILRIIQKLPSTVYAQCKKVLDNAGGKWDRRIQGHLFGPTGIRDLLASLDVGTSEDKVATHQVFYTPPQVAGDMATMLSMNLQTLRGKGRFPLRVLEPSIGDGALALALLRIDPAVQITGIDIRPEAMAALRAKNTYGMTLIDGDFLDLGPESSGFGGMFDGVIMNPPFTKGQDMRHIMHAWKFLRPGGCLVALASPSFIHSDRHPAAGFKKWIGEVDGGDWESLPEQKFGRCNISVVRFLIRKPALTAVEFARQQLANI